jgi:spore coat protein U-like protein
MKLITSSRRLALAATLASLATPTFAATATTSLTVTGTVVATCSVSASALNFGGSIPTPVNGDITAQGAINATCSTAVPFDIALNVGQGQGATMASRKMSSGTNTVNYQIHSDATRSTIWGDGSPNAPVNRLTGTGLPMSIPVFGRIPMGQSPAIGIYSDTILVTLTF